MYRLLMIATAVIVLATCGARMVVGQLDESASDTLNSEKDVLFYDSFESGDMSATNEAGFKWGKNNRTSVITSKKVVWNNGPKDVPRPEGRDWEAKTGDHALRFRYPAGENMAEQRFSLGEAYPEIWIRFWLRVPENFSHTSESPSNNKLFRIWMDDYENVGSKAGMEFRSLGDEGDSRFYMKAGRPFGDTGSKPFIDVPDDRGKWMQLVIHLKANSGSGSKDSVFRVWRRWEGEDEFKQTHKKTDFNIEYPDGGPQGFTKGYLMGWANGAYLEDTEWLLDDFTLSKRSLLKPDAKEKE